MADTSSAVTIGAIISALAPWVVAIVGALGLKLLQQLAAMAEKDLNIKTTAAQQNEIDREIATLVAKAETWAGTLVAADPTNLAGQSIKVGSPLIANAVNRMVRDLPQILKNEGWTPESVAKLLVGKIGDRQTPISVNAMTRIEAMKTLASQ